MRQPSFFALGLLACGSSSAPVAEPNAGIVAPPLPPLDPAQFDCTSLGKPSREPPTTLACIRDPKCAGRFVAGHRGAGGELGVLAPEDSLAALKELALRADEYAGDFSCERIPTLEEVLATAKGHAIVLVDANKTDRVDLLVSAIQKTETLEWAVFDTSSLEKIDEALASSRN